MDIWEDVGDRASVCHGPEVIYFDRGSAALAPDHAHDGILAGDRVDLTDQPPPHPVGVLQHGAALRSLYGAGQSYRFTHRLDLPLGR